jgi:hypothetical protein
MTRLILRKLPAGELAIDDDVKITGSAVIAHNSFLLTGK